ncbi:DUF4232 domain-containing protein [Amycolatopsis anabasis]|uniref:DUF4232 domain-containing protein n=1 Tax=Amycolatopsis anabasis TaxID=1840409 RepID=UPI00131C56DC|nr:DUF4232 domain-containing protein [Amycolatopsis anabasis]
MVRTRIPQLGLAVTGAALAVALTGCGNGGTPNAQPSTSSAPTTSASETPSSSSPPASSTPGPSQQPPPAQPDNGLCKSANLQLSLGQGDGAAGTVYRPLKFTNTGDQPCTIQGFPGVSYVAGDDGHQVGPAAFRDGQKGGPVLLKKGETAFADVGFVTVQNYEPGVCKPQPVRGLRVYPPQETESKFVEYNGTGCAGDQIPGNQLTVKSIVKGGGD